MGKKSMNFDDDEPFLVASADSSVRYVRGNLELRVVQKRHVPLEKTDHVVVVQVMGRDHKTQRCGVDIVAVLDVSYSRDGKNLEKLKTSMKFLIKKLSLIDRLSIVTFSSDAKRLCPLTAMHENGKAKIEKLINKLDADGYTNMTPGLQTALSVLAQRREQEQRTSAIMLMSHGELTSGCDHPSTVDVSGVPVYTFGLGDDHDSQLLQEIASKSNKGTYSIADVEGPDSANLNIAFSSCLEGLLNVVLPDLNVTIRQEEDSEIQEVRAGNYDQVCNCDNSVSISFGNVWYGEIRRATVFLSLPAVQRETSSTILSVKYYFRRGERLFCPRPYYVAVTRTSSPVSEDPIEVRNEIARGDTAAAMQKAREQVDANDFDGAKNTLNKVENSLDNLNSEGDEFIKALKYEVQEFLRLIKDNETYRKEGRAFDLYSKLAQNLQRFAARGDAAQLLGPEIELPLADQDKKEVAEQSAKSDGTADKEKKEAANSSNNNNNNNNNPIVAQLDTLNQHLGQIAVTLKAIQDSIAALKSA